jgi:glycerol-3-phosphate dehydrogenase
MTKASMADVIIVGAGATGCTLALREFGIRGAVPIGSPR